MKKLHKVQTLPEFVREHKRGDVRDDGKVFESYRYVGGKVYERWCTPEQLSARKAAANVAARAWGAREENRPLVKAYAAKSNHERRQKDVRPFLLVAARARAKKSGVEFSIEIGDIPVPRVCPVLGIPIHVGTGSQTDNSPSIDRIDPSIGYVKGNVAVISRRANRIKNDATEAELRKVLEYVRRHRR